MTLQQVILELQAIEATLGPDVPVTVEYGGEQHDTKSVSFEGSTNGARVVVHG